MEAGIHVPVRKHKVSLTVNDAASGNGDVAGIPCAKEKAAVPAVHGIALAAGGERQYIVLIETGNEHGAAAQMKVDMALEKYATREKAACGHQHLTAALGMGCINGRLNGRSAVHAIGPRAIITDGKNTHERSSCLSQDFLEFEYDYTSSAAEGK